LNPEQETQTEEPAEQKEKSALLRDMRDIQSEAAQLAEVEELEEAQTLKLVESMKVLQSGVETAISIRPQSLGEPLVHVKQAIIGAEAVIIGLDVEGKPFSLPLSHLKPADVLNVVGEWAPKLRERILERKKESERRLYLMEKFLSEFKEGSTAIKNSRKQFYESVESDLVRDDIQRVGLHLAEL